MTNKRALKYCLDRKVSLDQINKHSIGYYSGNPMSMYHDRVLFPIHDVYGNLLSFQGRALFDFKSADRPKYFHGTYEKSNHLYGLYDSLHILGFKPFVLVVEGPFDVIALIRAGIPAVSGFGTAFSQEQALLLRRFFNTIGVWYDQDKAGKKGADNTVSVCSSAGFKMFDASHSGIKDCADFVVAHSYRELYDHVRNAHSSTSLSIR